MTNITKFLKNVSGKMIELNNEEIFPPDQVLPINKKRFIELSEDKYLLEKIKSGDVKVSSDGETFMGNPLHGYIYFLNTFDDGGNILYNNNPITITPTIRRDRKTGIEATSLSLSLFQILKDFYNDPLNPLYTGKDYLTVYWDNVPKLKKTVEYFEDVIKKQTYKRPRRIIIQNGSHSKENLLKFDIIIFDNPSEMIDQIKNIKPTTIIFGKVSNYLSLDDFTRKVNLFSNKIDGIFISNTGYDNEKEGYDHGGVSTNSREKTNEKIDYVHNLNKIIMVDTNNINHIYGISNDPLYSNDKWNPNLIESSFTKDDWYLINKFVLNNGEFKDKEEWLSEMNKIFEVRKDININLCGLCDIPSSDSDSYNKYYTVCIASAITALDAIGNEEGIFYKKDENPLNNVIIWDKYPKIVIEDDFIRRYFEGATVSVDFSTNYNHSIERLL
jgi:hypothetical protein